MPVPVPVCGISGTGTGTGTKNTSRIVLCFLSLLINDDYCKAVTVTPH
jgi:hypothetical protein